MWVRWDDAGGARWGRDMEHFALTHGTIVVRFALRCSCIGNLFLPSCVMRMGCGCMFMVEGEGKMHVVVIYLRYRGCCLYTTMVV